KSSRDICNSSCWQSTCESGGYNLPCRRSSYGYSWLAACDSSRLCVHCTLYSAYNPDTRRSTSTLRHCSRSTLFWAASGSKFRINMGFATFGPLSTQFLQLTFRNGQLFRCVHVRWSVDSCDHITLRFGLANDHVRNSQEKECSSGLSARFSLVQYRLACCCLRSFNPCGKFTIGLFIGIVLYIGENILTQNQRSFLMYGISLGVLLLYSSGLVLLGAFPKLRDMYKHRRVQEVFLS